MNYLFEENQYLPFVAKYLSYQDPSTSSLVDNILDYAQGNTIDNLNAFHGAPAFWSDLIDLANNSISLRII